MVWGDVGRNVLERGLWGRVLGRRVLERRVWGADVWGDKSRPYIAALLGEFVHRGVVDEKPVVAISGESSLHTVVGGGVFDLFDDDVVTEGLEFADVVAVHGVEGTVKNPIVFLPYEVGDIHIGFFSWRDSFEWELDVRELIDAIGMEFFIECAEAFWEKTSF